MNRIVSLLLVLVAFLAFWQTISAQAPNPSWTRRFDGNGDQDYITGIATDANNRVYVTGFTKRSSTEFDYFTVRFGSDGSRIGQDTIDPGTIDQANSISVGGTHFYVTGKSKQGTYYKITTAQYDTACCGRPWVKTFSFGTQNDAGVVVRADAGGVPFVAGNAKYTSTNADIFILKYSVDGGSVTSTSFDVSGNRNDFLNSMSLDTSDNVLTAGSAGGYGFVVKHNSSLARQWTYMVASGSAPLGAPIAIDVDTSGFVYAAGATGYNIHILRFKSSDGTVVDTFTYSKTNAIAYQANDLKVRKSDNTIYLTGTVTESIFPFQYYRAVVAKLIKLGSTYQFDWATEFGWGTGAFSYVGSRINVDTNGNVYVGGVKWNGSTGGGGESTDLMLLKYNSSGSLQWSRYIDGDFGYMDTLTSMAVDKAGNLYLGGASKEQILRPSSDWPASADMFLVQFGLGVPFIPRAEFISPGRVNDPAGYHLDQNYPNPFNPTTTIRFSLPQATTVSLKIYDVTGREIKTLIDNESYGQGPHTVRVDASGFASGAYFYKVVTGDKSLPETKKMLLIR